jgi:hypothetical protein
MICPWNHWRGKRVRRLDDGAVYIATQDGGMEWQYRLRVWRHHLLDCPIPMPEGHLIFQLPQGYEEVSSNLGETKWKWTN